MAEKQVTILFKTSIVEMVALIEKMVNVDGWTLQGGVSVLSNPSDISQIRYYATFMRDKS